MDMAAMTRRNSPFSPFTPFTEPFDAGILLHPYGGEKIAEWLFVLVNAALQAAQFRRSEGPTLISFV